jgi:hypothetical protein
MGVEEPSSRLTPDVILFHGVRRVHHVLSESGSGTKSIVCTGNGSCNPTTRKGRKT